MKVDPEKGPTIHRAVYRKGCYEDDLVVQRALARLGEKEYNFVTNFVRAFPEWCKTGRGRLTYNDKAADKRFEKAMKERHPSEILQVQGMHGVDNLGDDHI